MSDKVVKIVTEADRFVDTDLVARVETLLEQVKAGELLSLSFVGIMTDKSIMTSSGPTPDMFSTIGALELLKFRLLEGMD